jgi:hypothetical protein
MKNSDKQLNIFIQHCDKFLINFKCNNIIIFFEVLIELKKK